MIQNPFAGAFGAAGTRQTITPNSFPGALGDIPQTPPTPAGVTPPPPGVAPQAGGFDMNEMLRAFSQLIQQQGQNQLGQIKEAGMAPQTRHLGMSGEDITGKTGPYDSGGIDWAHAHNSGAGLQSMPMGGVPNAPQRTFRAPVRF